MNGKLSREVWLDRWAFSSGDSRVELVRELVLATEQLERKQERQEKALRECARRIIAWSEQHSEPDACAVLGLARKMLAELIFPALVDT